MTSSSPDDTFNELLHREWTREIAHLEAPGVIDLRITRAGWARVREDVGHDAAVHHDPARRDWIELHLRSPADLNRLGTLVAVAMAANA